MDVIAGVLGVLAVPLLVLANAFFVAAEFALVAVPPCGGRASRNW
jgi:CBS domain containing-hemolysin-like protein